MADNLKTKFGIQRKRNYLSRDFDDFRLDLLKYANTYFKDKIQDFTEASLGGLFLDMAAYIGDNMSFYLDHQFRELDPTTVVESQNIEAMIKNAGLKITGNAPASATVYFYLEIPATTDSITGELIPNHLYLPKIKDGAKLSSTGGVEFHLTGELDFALKNKNDLYIAEVSGITNTSGVIESFIFTLPGLCVSGEITTQTSTIPDTFIQYRTISLDKADVTSILRIYDSDGNDYYEVESLSQDTVFRKNKIASGDTSIEIISAPYRYTTSTNISSRKTSIRFGAGNAASYIADTIPDPSDLALPLYGKQTFSSFSLDPNQLLQSPSLGVSPVNTTMTIIYRYGGGSTHNVAPEAINGVSEIEWSFLNTVPYIRATDIKNSLSVSNPKAAAGGAAAPSLTDLKNYVTNARTMQNRVVTTEDLLARIYTLPTEFGIVYRANVLPNPENALSSILYIISRDIDGRLSQSSDALKKNISTYLNEFRLIGDAMDVLDAIILNYQIKIECRFSHAVNKFELISLIIRKVRALFSITRVSMGKPIIKSEILNTVINITGVISVISLQIVNVSGLIDDRVYSTSVKNLDLSYQDDIYFAEPYEIFELRYPQNDILVTVK